MLYLGGLLVLGMTMRRQSPLPAPSSLQPEPLWAARTNSLSLRLSVQQRRHAEPASACTLPAKQASECTLPTATPAPLQVEQMNETHNSLLQSVEVAPQDAAMFWSAAEDGQLRQYDLRLR